MKNRSILQKTVKQKLVLSKDHRALTLYSQPIHQIKEICSPNDNVEKKLKQVAQNNWNSYENSRESQPSSLKRQDTKEFPVLIQRKSEEKIEEKVSRENGIRPRAKSETPYEKCSHRLKKKLSVNKKYNYKYSKFFEIVDQIINILTLEGIIQMKTLNLLTVNKNKFQELLIALFESMSKTQMAYEQQKECSLPFLQETFQKLQNYLRSQHLKTKTSKLSQKSNIYSRTFRRQDYVLQFGKLTNDILKLKQQQQAISEKIGLRLSEYDKITEVCREKQLQTTELMRKSTDLQVNIQKQEAKYSLLLQNVQEKERMLQTISAKAYKIFNFVEQQEQKKILHYVSQAYKEIQSQIYDYALYLQTNAMASSLTWQPKPFRAVEKWVYQEMERVNRFVMCASQSNQDKSAKMKTFITNTTRKFRTKDEQMMKITDFKTECIKKFIKMMQKWLENWELKQEYLVSLRTEFAIESEQFSNLLNKFAQLQKTQAASELVPDDIPGQAERLKCLWHKIELNYKYGNSFY